PRRRRRAGGESGARRRRRRSARHPGARRRLRPGDPRRARSRRGGAGRRPRRPCERPPAGARGGTAGRSGGRRRRPRRTRDRAAARVPRRLGGRDRARFRRALLRSSIVPVGGLVEGVEHKQHALSLTRKVAELRAALISHVLGQDALVDQLLLGILAGGHLLVEGLPGLGKTLLVRMLGCGLGLEFSRIQFTPDLMPADVTGTLVIDERGGQRTFRFQRGPVFAGLVLADEINRATPK